jgi:RNA polymerase sigma-70 factor, ECF subfamily
VKSLLQCRNSKSSKLIHTDYPAPPGDARLRSEGSFAVYTTSLSLLQRLREPSEKLAWDRFVLLYTPLILQWAGRLGLREPEASDLVQEVFLLLVRKLRQFQYRPDQRFRGWLWTVTLNKCRELGRRRPDLPLAVSAEDLANVVAPDTKHEYEETEYRQYLIERALQLMREDFQPSVWKACWECVVAGRPGKEVAQELGMTVNAVYLAKSRVLRRLHQELSGLID